MLDELRKKAYLATDAYFDAVADPDCDVKDPRLKLSPTIAVAVLRGELEPKATADHLVGEAITARARQIYGLHGAV